MYIMGMVCSIISGMMIFASMFYELDKDWLEIRDFIVTFTVIWMFIVCINNI